MFCIFFLVIHVDLILIYRVKSFHAVLFFGGDFKTKLEDFLDIP